MKEKRMKNQKKMVNLLIITAILSVIVWMGVKEQQNNEMEQAKNRIKSVYDTQSISSQYEEKKDELKVAIPRKEYPKEEIEEEYKGYAVAAKLQIPTIDLETYVLKKYSKEALNVSVTKFWGADANQVGNFCIAGHNFKNKNMFNNLKKLNLGETLTIIDNIVGKVEYEIYDIYTVLPEEVSCLSQETKGKKEVTLITCTSDSSKRIIVKAKER